MHYQLNIRKKIIRTISAVFFLLLFTAGYQFYNADAATTIATPKITVSSRTTQSVNLKITSVSGATGYQIYRSTSKSGTYSKIKTTKELTYKDTNITASMKYYYKVRAYKKSDAAYSYSSFSAIKGVNTTLSKVQNVQAQTTSILSLSWSKVSGATSYRIYRSTSKSGTYSYLKSSKTLTFVDTSAKNDKTYYYKVRAYKVSNSIKYYGAYSAIASGKVSSNAAVTATTYVDDVIALCNVERAKEGLSALTEDTTVSKAANARAKEIVSTFSHTRPDGTSCFTVLSDYSVSYRACGENIAYGQKTPEEVVTAWMNSEGHRANIMSSNFSKIGIGYYVTNNTAYWVQLFIG